MSPKVIQVAHAGGYRLALTFEDGLKSVVDFEPRLSGRNGIWTPLRDVECFKRVSIDPELQTIVWPNGVDICPDVLYGLASGRPLADVRTKNPAAV